MKRTLLILTLLSLIIACTPKLAEQTTAITQETMSKLSYPDTKRDLTVVDDYHGTEVADPYRWLEDDHSAETKAWVTAQNNVTFDYLQQIPFRDSLKQRIQKLWDYERFGIPFKEGDAYYYFKNNGLQNQSVLYSVDKIDATEGKLVLDPNKFSEDGTSSLGALTFNKDGNLIAYQVSEGGSDWRTIKVMDVASGETLSDRIEWVKFSGISWAGNGFYYSRYPAPNENDELSAKVENHAVYYHKIGDDQSQDKLIFLDEEFPQRNAFAGVDSDERFLMISTSESTSGNAFYIKDLTNPDADLIQVVEAFDHDYSYIGTIEDRLYFTTNHGASKNQLVAYDYNDLKVGQLEYKTVIAESDDALRGVSIVGNKFFASYLHNASSQIKAFDANGNFIANVNLPGIGTSSGVVGKKTDQFGFISFASYTSPGSIYRVNTESLDLELFRQPKVDFDGSQYETVQKWYTSKDGTKVPMFITYKKGIPMDGSAPTLLYGYGGFDIPVLPRFDLKKIPIIEAGGIYAVANIRGGGEFGAEWHKAGTKGEKQNVFDDFIGAAEYLIAEGYTSSNKLAIEGRSNGGLLVGACMTQRPDLYQVAFPGVGVLDMLRYHLFTIGWAWAGDYGRSDEADAFDYLYEYSPLHNVKAIDYPATMVTTADHDDRVVPAHSFKYISELQHKNTSDNPMLIRIDVSAGHGAGMPTDMQIQQAADMLAFMFYEMR